MYDYYSGFKNELFRYLVTDADEINIKLSVAKIKSDFDDEMSTTLFSEIYILEMINHGLLDEKGVYTDVSTMSDKYYSIGNLISKSTSQDKIYTIKKSIQTII